MATYLEARSAKKVLYKMLSPDLLASVGVEQRGKHWNVAVLVREKPTLGQIPNTIRGVDVVVRVVGQISKL